jgi:hypothetical protein
MKEGTANCIDILIAIILPPLGVFLKFGCKVCTSPSPLSPSSASRPSIKPTTRAPLLQAAPAI